MARILLVDDDKEFRENWTKTLIGKGYEVTQAGSEGEARDLILSNPAFDVVLVDMCLTPENITGEGGLSVIERVKKERDSIYTEIIIITGKMEVEAVWNNIQKAVELGISRWLDKTEDFGKNLPLTIKGVLRYKEAILFYFQEIRKISARAAHKIGTRMATMDAIYSRLKDMKLSTELEGEIEALEGQSRRTKRITNEFCSIIALSRLKLEEIDIVSLLKESLYYVNKIEVIYNLPSVPLKIEGDAERLEGVFLELASNAKSFMENGGKLTVSAEISGKDRIKIEFLDTGPGILREEKERIFEPFFTKKEKGTGLGLAIVKEVIKAHQGSVEEKGVPDKGARFIISLPTRPTRKR